MPAAAKRTKSIVPVPARVCATHEAGHAVIARHYKFDVAKVTLECTTWGLYATPYRAFRKVRGTETFREGAAHEAPHVRKHLVILAAGEVAAVLFHGSAGSRTGSQDDEDSERMLSILGVNPEEIRRRMISAARRADDLVQQHYDAIETLASELLARGKLSRREVVTICDSFGVSQRKSLNVREV